MVLKLVYILLAYPGAKFWIKEAQCLVKVLKSLSWAFPSWLGCEKHNFTRLALFHSSIFGEGIPHSVTNCAFLEMGKRNL